MSGPLSVEDTLATSTCDTPAICDPEVLESRHTDVGGFAVERLLPQRPRRTVGAWCFLDLMGPGEISAGHGLNIGPHPHMGLQTVTWLLHGVVLHRDSLGSEQLIRPGELNLMTAGRGVSHSEETTGVYLGQLHGVQLWVAQPTATRDGHPAFEHHPQLPRVDLANSVATVLVGGFGGVESVARRDTDHVGVDLDLQPGRTVVPLNPQFEYTLVATDGRVAVGTHHLEPGHLGYLGLGRHDLPLDASAPVRALLLGGVPFPEALVMWWNYVARSREEITAAHRSWMAGDDRFGPVTSSLGRMEIGGPPWAKTTPGG